MITPDVQGSAKFSNNCSKWFQLDYSCSTEETSIAMHREQQTFNKSACDVHLHAIWNLDEAQNKLTIAVFL